MIHSGDEIAHANTPLRATPFTFEAGLRAGRGEMFNRTMMVLEKVLGRESMDFKRIHEMMRMIETELNGPSSGAERTP